MYIYPEFNEKSKNPKLIPKLDMTLLEKSKNPKLIPKLDITLLNKSKFHIYFTILGHNPIPGPSIQMILQCLIRPSWWTILDLGYV